MHPALSQLSHLIPYTVCVFMCVFMCVCIYIHIYVYMHIHTYIPPSKLQVVRNRDAEEIVGAVHVSHDLSDGAFRPNIKRQKVFCPAGDRQPPAKRET